MTSSRIVVGRRARERGERVAARGGELQRLGLVARGAHVAGAMRARDRLHPRGLVRDGRRVAVGFHQQHRFAVGRQADVRVVLDAAGRHPVEKLQRAGNDPRRDDGGDRFGGVLDAVVEREHRPARGRPRDAA